MFFFLKRYCICTLKLEVLKWSPLAGLCFGCQLPHLGLTIPAIYTSKQWDSRARLIQNKGISPSQLYLEINKSVIICLSWMRLLPPTQVNYNFSYAGSGLLFAWSRTGKERWAVSHQILHRHAETDVGYWTQRTNRSLWLFLLLNPWKRNYPALVASTKE